LGRIEEDWGGLGVFEKFFGRVELAPWDSG